MSALPSGRAVKIGEMLFADGADAASLESFQLIVVGHVSGPNTDPSHS